MPEHERIVHVDIWEHWKKCPGPGVSQSRPLITPEKENAGRQPVEEKEPPAGSQ